MANTKEYQIKINGISESISAIDSLNKKLENLEQRINTINTSKVSSSAGGSSSSSNVSSLSEEEAIQREINKLKEEGQRLDAKIAASQDEIYKRVDATKQLYKEIIADQKSLAAQERLQANTYNTNTMQGMKERLADLKSVINTTDLGDTDKLKQLTEEANKLNAKLLEVEKSYGQFGRNVGNYPDAAKNLQAIVVTIGGIDREFNNAREATRTLNNELKTMAVNGEQGTQKFKDLQKAVAKLNSDIKDATVSSKAMDNLLDTMQSITAIGSVTKGFSALFGFDDSEIEKSIQKLVALQNAMQGIEKINQQMKSGEFMGGLFSKGNAMIDSFVAKLTGASKAQQELNAANIAGKTASEGLAVAETAQATATAGATVATKALSFALKTLGIGLIITAVAYLVENWKDLYKWLTDTFPALKNLSKWFDKIKAVAMGVGSAIVNYMIQPLATLVKTIQAVINGNFSEIPKIISEGFKKTFNIVGNYQKGYNREIERQQEAHNNKMREQQKKANEEWLKDEEAKYGKSHKRTQEYLKKQMSLTKKGSAEYKELQRKLWEDERQEREESQKKSNSQSKKNAQEAAEIEKEMVQLRLNAMKEGLNKTITQLEEERKQRIAKLRANGKQYKEEEAEVNRIYDQKILDEKNKWAEKVEKIYSDMWDKIKADSIKNTKNLTSLIQSSIENVNQEFVNTSNKFFDQNIGSYGVQGKGQMSPTTQLSLGIVSENKSEFITEMKEYIDMVRELETAQNEYNASYSKLNDEFNKLSDEQKGILNVNLDLQKNYWNTLKRQVDDYEEYLKEKYGDDNFNGAKTLLFEENYSSSLALQFNQRMSAIEAYWALRKKTEAENAEALYKQQKKELDEAYEADKDASWKNYQAQLKQADEFYKKKLDLIKQNEKDGTLAVEDAELERRELEAEYQKTSTQMYQNWETEDKQLRLKHVSDVDKIELDKINKLKSRNAEYYQSALQELRDFQTAQNSLENKQLVKNAWGITNFKQTNENNRNLLASYEAMANKINEKRKEVNEYFQNGLIDKDIFDSTIRELDNFADSLGNKIDDVKKKLTLGDQIGEFFSDIQQYVQALGQGLQTIMSAVWSAQDTEFDNESRQLDKLNEKLQTAMDKNEEILEKHKDNVQSIEEELSTARGDRRQHLIDQLNAEMNAERRAAAEKKRLEKEQEALKKKQEKLDQRRQEAQYDRELAQIWVSGALAAMNAYATKPFVPVGLAMGSLALGITAAQYAIAKAHPPKFANGGLLEGRSHAQGGIKAGGVELEGHEYVINKHTTMDNLDLLEYINSKKKRIDISDLVDFYGGTVKTTIKKMSPSRKYADGGVLPTLSTDYSFDDRLLNAFEDYSNRPVYVSVQDINSRQKAVKNVQVLAGIQE